MVVALTVTFSFGVFVALIAFIANKKRPAARNWPD